MRTFLTIGLACLASAAAAHDPISWNGSEVQVLLGKEESSGEMGIFTNEFFAPGGPPRHVHQDAGEAFVVLEGAADVVVDGESVNLKEGEAGFAPKGADHTFHITGESGGKLLVIVAPGGFEGFFEATKHLKLPDELDELNRISAEFGQIFTGPPLAEQ